MLNSTIYINKLDGFTADNLSRGVERHRNMRFRQTAADVSISQPQSLREPFDHYNSACPEFPSNRLQEIYGTRTASQAAQALDQTSPALSAKRGLSEAQKFVFAGLFLRPHSWTCLAAECHTHRSYCPGSHFLYRHGSVESAYLSQML